MKQWQKLCLVSLFALLFAHAIVTVTMRFSNVTPKFLAGLSLVPLSGAWRDYQACGADLDVSLDWHPPPKTDVNDLERVIHGEGVHGFIFDTSDGSPNEYNFCNMPRVNPETYPYVDTFKYHLEYVEIITRHHKRTPYAHNLFPEERNDWYCDNEIMFYGGQTTGENSEGSAHTYWSVYTTDANPFTPSKQSGTCQFPQVSKAGLQDSYNHGQDSREVYRERLHFLRGDFHAGHNTYRVTNNPITSQVASQFILGMWHAREGQDVALLIQPAGVDSLEPGYSCPAATELYNSYGPGSDSNEWTAHLRQSADLKKRLDEITGVNPEDRGWTTSWDHYFDNFAARLCHQMPLPCNRQNTTNCVTKEDAEEVFRLGQYEYSYMYRDSEESLRASAASYGVYLGELVQNLRHFMSDEVGATVGATPSRVRWRHNIAHDGSIARLLSMLQVNQMLWPGMGAELVFELYRSTSDFDSGVDCYFLRVLWGGQIMRSSHPAFGRMDMIPVGTFLAYVDGLVGVRGSKIPAMCSGSL